MKKKIFAMLSAAAMLCGCLAAPASAAEAKDYQMGDVNMDGVVDITDAQLALEEYVTNFTLGTHCFNEVQLVLGNVDGKSKYEERPVDIADCLIILQYYTIHLTAENITLADITGRTETYIELWTQHLENAKR